MNDLEINLDEVFKDNPELLALYKKAEQTESIKKSVAQCAQVASGTEALPVESQNISLYKRRDDEAEETPQRAKKEHREEERELAPPTLAHRIQSQVVNVVFYLFIIVMIAGATMFALSGDTQKTIFGYRFYNVLTPSMRPAFDPGDMIFVKYTNADELKVGDVVTFTPSKTSTVYLTHRIVEIREDENSGTPYIVTRGDANNANDPPVSAATVVGVYQFRIPKAGNIITFVRENFIVLAIVIVALFALIVLLKSYFAIQESEKRQAGDEA